MKGRKFTCSICRTWYLSQAKSHDAMVHEFADRRWLSLVTPRDRMDGSHARNTLTLLCNECLGRIFSAGTLTKALALTYKPTTNRATRTSLITTRKGARP